MLSGEIDAERLLPKFRKLVSVYKEAHQLESAVFWAGQAAALSNWADEDVIRLAHCLIASKLYHRAANLLELKNLDTSHLEGCFLTSKAVYEAGDDLDRALFIIENASNLIEKAQTDLEKKQSSKNIEQIDKLRQVLGSIFLLKGQILESMDNRLLAAEAFKDALHVDAFCHEAFIALTKHEMLSSDEERKVIASIPIESQSETAEEKRVVRFLYELSMKKYDKPSKLSVPTPLNNLLHTSAEFRIAKAERFFYNCNYRSCFDETTSIINENPFHGDCLPIHISCMVELRKTNDLFLLAHKLVDFFPEWCVAWFAVGCYYMSIGKHELARNHLCKATQIDRVFGPAWLAYGHSFALENEHDQAMAAYFKASQLMRGCHLPMLYVGVEHVLTNNSRLAEQFFAQALEIAPKDPFVLHEMGVAHFQNREYTQAEKCFTAALRQVRQIDSHGKVTTEKWESLYNNLGHTCRKLCKYEDALAYHRQALVLKPQNASTYSAIGFVQALQGNLLAAIESFHKALGLRRSDTFSTTMLNSVIEQSMTEDAPFQGCPVDTPKIDFSSQSLPGCEDELEASGSVADIEMDDMSTNMSDHFTP